MSRTDWLLVVAIILLLYGLWSGRSVKTVNNTVETVRTVYVTDTVVKEIVTTGKVVEVPVMVDRYIDRLPAVDRVPAVRSIAVDTILVKMQEKVIEDSVQVGEALVFYKHYLAGKFTRPSSYAVEYPEKSETVTKSTSGWKLYMRSQIQQQSVGIGLDLVSEGFGVGGLYYPRNGLQSHYWAVSASVRIR